MFTEFSDYFASLGKSKRTAEEYVKEARYFASFCRESHRVDMPDEDLLLLATKDDAYAYIIDCTKKDLSKATLQSCNITANPSTHLMCDTARGYWSAFQCIELIRTRQKIAQ